MQREMYAVSAGHNKCDFCSSNDVGLTRIGAGSTKQLHSPFMKLVTVNYGL